MAKYLKHDTEKGYIEDNAEIEYTQFCNLRHTILGCMMGDFDEQGRYIISPAIRDELIQMPKYLVDSMENVDICASVLKLDKQLSFLVTYEGNRATLSLMEKMNYESNATLGGGSYSNIVEYLLDEVETSGIVNRNTIFAHWNISEYGGSTLDVFNMNEETIAIYFNLVNRFKYLMVANKLLLKNEKEMEEIEADYANRIFDILEGYPKLKQLVEKELKQTLEEKKDFIRLDKPNFAKTINEIVEKAIQNNIGVLSEKQQEEFKVEKHNAQMETNIRRREIIDIKKEPVEAENTIHLEEGESVDFTPEVKSTIVKLDTNFDEVASVNDVATERVEQEAEVNNESKNKAFKALLGDLKHETPVEEGSTSELEDNKKGKEGLLKRLGGANPVDNKVKVVKNEEPAREETSFQKLINRVNNISEDALNNHVGEDVKKKVTTEQQKRVAAKVVVSGRGQGTDNVTPVYATVASNNDKSKTTPSGGTDNKPQKSTGAKVTGAKSTNGTVKKGGQDGGTQRRTAEDARSAKKTDKKETDIKKTGSQRVYYAGGGIVGETPAVTPVNNNNGGSGTGKGGTPPAKVGPGEEVLQEEPTGQNPKGPGEEVSDLSSLLDIGVNTEKVVGGQQKSPGYILDESTNEEMESVDATLLKQLVKENADPSQTQGRSDSEIGIGTGNGGTPHENEVPANEVPGEEVSQ